MSEIRYRGFGTDQQILELIHSLVVQKASGRAVVDFNGTRLEFNSPAQIELTIQDLEKEIARREAVAAGKTKRRSWIFNPDLPSGGGYL